MDQAIAIQVEEKLKLALREKFKNYKYQDAYMPFHIRLLGKDRLALYSFIHSLNTNFGTTLFEPVAALIASSRFKTVHTQYRLGQEMSENAFERINQLVNNLTTGITNPDKTFEIEEIRKASSFGNAMQRKTVQVDLFLQDHTATLRTKLSGDTTYFEDFSDEVGIFEQVRFYAELPKNA